MELLWIVLAVLVVIGGAGYRRRLGGRTGPDALDDDDVRRIERDGRVWVEPEAEPLDLDEIREEEERFWEEGWDEPEAW